ncbi:MAG: hypothetical protein FJ279_21415 [Planctomycetes bacterium]|nr:hypothetical protein [Planctomycetota bacterium]
MRYLKNARQLAASAPQDGRTFTAKKPVREAFRIGFRGVLKAVDAYLMSLGFSAKELPKSVDGYVEAMERLVQPRDSSLAREFDSVYHALYLAGYQDSLLRDVRIVQQVLKCAERFIKRLGVAHKG